MPELELSVMLEDDAALATTRRLLQEFEAHTHIRVRLRAIPSKEAKQELTSYTVFHRGPDVSQVGSTWLRGIVDTNALRPFSGAEVRDLIDAEDMIPATLQSARLEDATLWAVPWYADVRMIYYRRDLLEQAGIDEATAFDTPAALGATLASLQAHGTAMPWTVPSGVSWRTLHNAASWVWQAGRRALCGR